MEIEKKKYFNRTRFVFKVLILFLLITAALFPTQILIKTVQWQLTRYCLNTLGASLQFEELFWENGKIVLSEGNLEKPKHFKATFRRALLKPTFSWKRREIGGELDIEGFKLVSDGLTFQKLSPPSLPFMTFNLTTTLLGGEIFLYNPSDTNRFSQHVYFNLSSSFVANRAFGEIDWAFPFECTTHFCKETGEKLNLTFQFHSPLFWNLVSYAFQKELPSYLRKWRLMQGSLNGTLAVEWIDAQPIKMKGALTANGVKGENRNLQLIGEIDHLQANVDIAASSNWDMCVNSLQIEGSSKQIHTLFPETLQQGIVAAFPDDQLQLDLTLKKSIQGLELVGELQIIDTDESYSIDFGSLLGSSKMSWFRAKKLPIEKFLSPFLLQKVRIDAFGKADFEGTFDGRHLAIFYEEEAFRLVSPTFQLISDRSSERTAIHYIDVESGEHEGFLYLKGASFWQKKYDILFDKADALVHFNKGTIHIKDIETSWNSLAFSGEIEVGIRAVDDVDLIFKADRISGSVQDAAALLSHFNHSIFWEIPLEGTVTALSEALYFQYHFTPRAKLVEGKMKGTIECTAQTPFFTLKEYQVPIDYNYSQNRVSFQEGEGTLFIPFEEKQVTLKSAPIILTEFPLFQTSFAFDIYDDANCLYAFEGTTQHSSEGRHLFLEGKGKTSIALQALLQKEEIELSHFTLGTWEGEGGLDWKKQQLWIDCSDQAHLALFGGWDIKADRLQARAVASIQNFEFKEIRIGDNEHLECSYSMDDGLTLEGLEIEFSPTQKLQTGPIHYDLFHQKIYFETFDFSVSTVQLLPFVPVEIPPILTQWARMHEHPLKGEASLEISPGAIWIQLQLEEGKYNVAGWAIDLKNFLLVYNPLELNIWTQCLYRETPYWLHLLTDSTTAKEGRVAISERELSSQHPEGNDSLIFSWQPDIQQVKGNFCGIHASLKATHTSEPIQLKGEVGFHPKQLISSLSGCCTLDGDFTIDKNDPSQMTFSGILSGSDLTVKGVELSTFSTKLFYKPDTIIFSDLSVKDWAGQLTVNEGEIERIEEQWRLSMHQLQLREVRLSRLRSPWTHFNPRDKPWLRSFFIRSFNLDGLSGVWGDVESFTGSGKLEFDNLPKRTFVSNLLFIPTEITARLGLDLTTLIPTRGTVFYDIQKGKIHLTEFKEMYSDGKHSQFYLVEEMPAFLDFEGNLNLKVKMKQYNLLMKLAELFTVTVEGTLFNPNYTFSHEIVSR